MPVAIAFHEEKAMQKLADYFTTRHKSTCETRPTVCSNCSLTFAVVLVNRADGNNHKYVEELRTGIEKDCDAGLHKEEYEWPPVHVQAGEEIAS
jgi:hypothetical protein